MTNRKLFCNIVMAIVAIFSLGSCVDEEEYADNPRGNFEALWKIVDEHYCFFDYKKEQYGLDWNAVYDKYSRQIADDMTDSQLFEVLGNMLGELKDGHVNMYSSWDVARNWSWHENYPSNLSDTLINRYLGTDYRIASGMRYRILDDNIGYIRCTSFATAMGEGNLDKMLINLMFCQGLIIDIRDNGGGNLTYAERFAARFFNERTHVGYIQHKTGRGHSDFSAMEAQYLQPGKGIRWRKPVCVLTNRSVYSAANEFVKCMKAIGRARKGASSSVTIIGDTTGGGAGMPFSSELPNGWGVRFSACPMYDADGNTTEFGIAPDVKVDITDEDFAKGLDSIIEAARR